VQAAGGTGEYRRADVTDRGAVRALVEAVLREHGRLDGIVHAAGVVSDGYLLRKDVEQARDVLAPKVRGAVLLDEATRELDLELFVLCSSLSATSGNAGQADYAAGNGFLDAFARERAARVRAGTRRGVSVSIGWPLWHDGGMRTETAALAAMRDSTGLVPLPTVEALRAFDLALACGEPHTVVLYGDRERAMAALAEEPGAGVAATRTADLPDLAGPSGLADAVLERLAVVFARMSGVAAAELDPDEEMGSYGLDSFMVTNINHALGQVFPRAPKTLFFEHPTLRGVAGALAADFATESRHWIDDHRPYTTELPTVAVHRAPDGVVRRAPTVPRTAAGSEPARPPIAVIGMSGRFPDADDLEAFWANLRAGRDSVTEVPADRWPLEGFYEPDPDLAVHEHKSYGKWGGFLSGHAEFDPLFFGISPREATEMDPQERLFLQECWRAVEDAGYSRRRLGASLGGRVGVFVGVTRSGYGLLGSRGSRVTPRTNFGSIANRVSFVLDLSGPSMPIDTMCSSSLTAVHEACEHIRRGECDAALVGGVNVYTHPDAFVEMSQRRMLSPTGRCRSFGESGDGLVPGEGVAAVLLRPLDRALADGDRVLAVLAGSAVNHGGRTSGYSVPNPVAQSRLVSAALFRAGVSAAEVSYVEAHGTGTALGDPIELSGLNVPFRRHGSTEGACALGSVKSNIGHLEAAAGIAGLVKIVLQLRHRELVPTLHASRPNPQLDLEGSPFRLQRELSAWKADVGPLTAGLSSFGAGGANAHVVVRALDDDNPAAALREEDR
jgi:3-oxoacyl-(acyl-carrier-protein) synthase